LNFYSYADDFSQYQIAFYNVISSLRLSSTVDSEPVQASAPDGTYSSTDWNYRLTLPKAWERIPREVVDSYGQQISKQTGEAPAEYNVVFQPKGRRPFAYPYFMIAHYPASGTTLESLMQECPRSALDAMASQYSHNGMYRSFAFGDAVMHRDLNCVTVGMTGALADGAQLKGFMAFVPCRWGAINLNFYSNADDYALNQSRFLAVLSSLEFGGSSDRMSAQTSVQRHDPSLSDGRNWKLMLLQVASWIGQLLGSSALVYVLRRLFALVAGAARKRPFKGLEWPYGFATAVACGGSFLVTRGISMCLGYVICGAALYLVESAVHRRRRMQEPIG
jgi:hypothetical protein